MSLKPSETKRDLYEKSEERLTGKLCLRNKKKLCQVCCSSAVGSSGSDGLSSFLCRAAVSADRLVIAASVRIVVAFGLGGFLNYFLSHSRCVAFLVILWAPGMQGGQYSPV